MTKAKSTRRALWASVVALLLCFTMLMGATFAWFTDNVSSTGNRIQAGDLEVDLIMDKLDGTGYNSIADGSGDIFSEATGNGINWEPGKTEVVYLGVRNNGSLALKYNIVLNIVDNALAGALEYAILDGATSADTYTSWADVKAASNGQTADLPTGRVVAAEGGVLDEIVNGTPEETDYFALAIHMKEEAGNEYENKSVEIDVQVVATQKEAELDSFGPDYDVDSEFNYEPDATWYESNPDAAEYVLSTPSELAALASIVKEDADFDATIKLGGNVDLTLVEWEPVGTVNTPFNGTIDGNGKSIIGLTVADTDYASFIAYAGEDAVIENLTLENVNLNSNKHAAGVVCIASNGVTIENVTVSGSITAASYAGGIVHNAPNSTIKNCTNNATITTNFSAAGIAAWANSNVVIDGCTNNGDISAANRAAGIVGNIAGSVSNCTNNGNVTCSGDMPVSGIAAVLSGATTIENCINKGDVTSTGADEFNASAGGILGHTPGSAVTITACRNEGKITAASSWAAGIGVSMYGGITATDCENTGAVTSPKNAEGIVAANGMFSGTNTVTNCTNTGVVTIG